MTTTNHSRLIAILAAIIAAAVLRLIPHPANFTPIGAIALFSGAYLGRKPIAFAAPFGALLLSDIVLGFYHGLTTVYGADLLVVLIGSMLVKRSPLRIGVAAVASSATFFVVTNFGMWLSSGIYARTFAGLETCFAAAIPFFQNSLAGDLFYTLLLFGGFSIAERLFPRLQPREPQLA